MMWNILNNDELRQHASRLFNKDYAAYCAKNEKNFPPKITDEVFSEHIKEVTGLSIAGTTFRQYRNSSRFQLQFYIIMSLLFKVPVTRFLMTEEQVEIDFQNHLSQRFFILTDIHTNKQVTLLDPAQATSMGLNQHTAALVVTNSNNSSKNLTPRKIALIDRSVSDVLVSGDYVLQFRDVPTIVTITRADLADTVDIHLPDGANTTTHSINVKDMIILGKVIGSIG